MRNLKNFLDSLEINRNYGEEKRAYIMLERRFSHMLKKDKETSESINLFSLGRNLIFCVS